MKNKVTKSVSVTEPLEEIKERLNLQSQPTWQLALELSVFKKKLERLETEINMLGESRSKNSVAVRYSIVVKISALQHEIEKRKELL